MLDYACSDEGAECCPIAATVAACGARTCNRGNTCDSHFDGYCSGVETTANCGQFACLGACTCKNENEACECPSCQSEGPCDVGGTLLHCVAYPNEPLAPNDAGACSALNDAGDFCCGAQP